MSTRTLAIPTAALALVLLGAAAGHAPAVAQAVEAMLVKDADHPARQPFQAESRRRVFGFGRFSSVLARVPDGKRLVIEYVSAWITNYGSADAVFEIHTVQDGNSVRHMIPLPPPFTSGFETNYVAGQPVRLYADPGTEVAAAVSLDGFREATDISVALSGHLVNLP